MADVSYEFYINTYYGSKLKDNNEFKRIKDIAESVVSKYTYGRYKLVTDEDLLLEVKKTICEIMDNIGNYEEINLISSESEGGRSISYNNNIKHNEIYNDVINRRLGTTWLTSDYIRIWWFYD